MSDPAGEPTTTRNGDETTVVPHDAQTDAVDLAWSVADPAPAVEAVADSRRPLSKTLLALLAVVAVAAVALGAFVLGQRDPDQTDTAPPPASTAPPSTAPPQTPNAAPVPPTGAAPQPTSTTSVAPPAPTSASAPPESAPPATVAPSSLAPDAASPDDAFIAQLQADGITFDSEHRALRVAHEVCWEFAQGNRESDIVAAVKADNQSLPDSGVVDLVTLSIDTYCPQYVSSH
jgi:hypothetical protein